MSTKERAASRLRAFAAAFVAIANDARDRKVDQPATFVSMNATPDARPLRDERLKWAGAMWGGSTAVMLLIGWLLWSRLVKERRGSDESPLPVSAFGGA